MITNILYNLFIEFVLFICIILWIIGACTVVLPLLWYITGGDYFYLTGFIEDMRFNKVKTSNGD